MSKQSCHKCDRDISKPSLVRCREENCPLKTTQEHSSRGVVLGLGGLALVALIGFGGYSFLSADRPDVSAAQTGDGPSVAVGRPSLNFGGSSSSNEESWLSSLFSGSDKGKGGDMPSSVPRITVPDPRAATRVSTFSCSGTLSSARSLVCTNWDLAITDYNLSLLFTSAIAESGNPNALRASQAAWRRELDKLGRDPALIQKHYNDRSAELSKIAG